MDLLKMIAELQDERLRLDEAIQALERLSASTKTRRRGRPPRLFRQGDRLLETDDKLLNSYLPKAKKTS